MSSDKLNNSLISKNIDFLETNSSPNLEEGSPVLCIYCKRTKDNGLRCIGRCVADNEY